MTPLSEKILSSYQVRKTKKQKSAFIDMMKAELPELQVEEGGMLKSRNLVLGDVKSAKIVLGAHYDTCAGLPFPNFIMPKNIILTLLYTVLITLPFIAVLIAADYLFAWLFRDELIAYLCAIAVFFVLYFYVFLLGKPNPHTVNDNTSGVITLCEIIEVCREHRIEDVAFVFFDHEEAGLFGSAFFSKRYKREMKEKLLLNFDCVSDGDHVLFVLNKPAMEQYGKIFSKAFPSTGQKTAYMEKSATTFYPSDQRNFPVSVAVSAMKKKNVLGLYLDRIHTKHDTVMDETNIRYLCDGMYVFLKSLHETPDRSVSCLSPISCAE